MQYKYTCYMPLRFKAKLGSNCIVRAMHEVVLLGGTSGIVNPRD